MRCLSYMLYYFCRIQCSLGQVSLIFDVMPMMLVSCNDQREQQDSPRAEVFPNSHGSFDRTNPTFCAWRSCQVDVLNSIQADISGVHTQNHALETLSNISTIAGHGHLRTAVYTVVTLAMISKTCHLFPVFTKPLSPRPGMRSCASLRVCVAQMTMRFRAAISRPDDY